MKYVISLGGSLIIPNEINKSFLLKFTKIIKDLIKNGNSVVIVCGGGKIARDYISVVNNLNAGEDFESLVGIECTKTNAALVAAFFKRFHLIPNSLEDVSKELRKDKLAVCGALGFQPKMTSDGDAALIASHIKADYFINLTNVDGLYNKDPKSWGAKFIPTISFSDFDKILSKIDFKAGQHFVLDQFAAKVIMREKIKTIILNGEDLENIKIFFSGEKFKGTVISE